MRLRLLALMAVLRPLRGWMGDGMAMESGSGYYFAIKYIANSADTTGAKVWSHLQWTAGGQQFASAVAARRLKLPIS